MQCESAALAGLQVAEQRCYSAAAAAAAAVDGMPRDVTAWPAIWLASPICAGLVHNTAELAASWPATHLLRQGVLLPLQVSPPVCCLTLEASELEIATCLCLDVSC